MFILYSHKQTTSVLHNYIKKYEMVCREGFSQMNPRSECVKLLDRALRSRNYWRRNLTDVVNSRIFARDMRSLTSITRKNVVTFLRVS